MQTDTIKANGQRTSLTPNADRILIDPTGRGSVEYAKARQAIQADFQLNFAMNQPLAKKMRKQSRHAIVDFLKGTVTLKQSAKAGEKPYYIVTFPDNSVARL
jgi:hypothetical protein